MADSITGKVWNLDTVTGVVTTSQVNIHGIYIQFTTAAAGSCRIVTGVTSEKSSSDERIIDCVSSATSTANAFELNHFYTFGNQSFKGLKKTLSVNVATILVITSNPT